MTVEVGVITGRLTVRTTVDDRGDVAVHVQYKEADEWYAVRHAHAHLANHADIEAAHALVVALLDRPDG
jgi:hypothetical protein